MKGLQRLVLEQAPSRCSKKATGIPEWAPKGVVVFVSPLLQFASLSAGVSAYADIGFLALVFDSPLFLHVFSSSLSIVSPSVNITYFQSTYTYFPSFINTHVFIYQFILPFIVSIVLLSISLSLLPIVFLSFFLSFSPSFSPHLSFCQTVLTFNRSGFAFFAGQYAWISVPCVSHYEWSV